VPVRGCLISTVVLQKRDRVSVFHDSGNLTKHRRKVEAVEGSFALRVFTSDFSTDPQYGSHDEQRGSMTACNRRHYRMIQR
jgi:hypothetical protein